MPRTTLSFFIGLFVLLTPGTILADWPSYRQDFTLHNSTSEQPEPPFELKGSFPSTYTSPVTAEGLIVTAESSEGTRKIVAYNINSLERAWQFSISTSYPRQLTIHDKKVYFVLSPKPIIYALELPTGREIWQRTIPGDTGQPQFAPVIVGNSLFVVTYSTLHRFTLTGQYVWSRTYNIQSALATDNEFLYFKVHTHVMKIEPLSGDIVWAHQLYTTVGTNPVLTQTAVYIGALNQLIALDKEEGGRLWSYIPQNIPQSHELVIGSISAIGSKIIFNTHRNTLTALDSSGQHLWTNQPNTYSKDFFIPHLLAGNRVLTRSGLREHTILNIEDGKVIFQGELPIPSANFQAVSDERIFMDKDNITYVLSAAHWTQSGSDEKKLDPVVIVPGILESWPVNGVWQLDPIFRIFKTLITGLHEAGYEDEKTLFTLPYDWHQSNVATGQLLQEKIEAIKAKTGAKKVDVIAHSMGGLAARSYIQGENYARDIDQLITIATPHHGSVKAYLTWEAGEVGNRQIDAIKEKLLKYEAKKKGYKKNVVKYIQEKIPSIRELLPIFNYLEKNLQMQVYSPCSEFIYPCNSFLEQLKSENSELSKVSLLNVVGETNVDATLQKLLVRPSHLISTWKHGIPIHYPSSESIIYGKGDGTVLTESARLTNVKEVVLESDHSRIVAESTHTVVKELTDKDIGIRIWLPPTRYIFVRLYSPADMLLTDKEGRRVGTDPSTGYLLSEIPEAYYSGNKTDQEYIILADPTDDNYSLSLKGTGDGGYELEDSLVIDGESIDESKIGSIKKDEVKQYEVVIQDDRTTTRELTPQVSPSSSPIPSPTPNSTSSTISSTNAISTPEASSLLQPDASASPMEDSAKQKEPSEVINIAQNQPDTEEVRVVSSPTEVLSIDNPSQQEVITPAVKAEIVTAENSFLALAIITLGLVLMLSGTISLIRARAR